MLLCEVQGAVVATAKSEALRGFKLMLVRERGPDGAPQGRAFVATDVIGAGAGETVLVVTGSAAREASNGQAPTDAAIVAIVDSFESGSSAQK